MHYLRNLSGIILLVILAQLSACGGSGGGDDSGKDVDGANDQVVTIYFAGTTMNSTMWDPDKPTFKRPETVATLHHFQEVGQVYPNQQGEDFPNGEGKVHTKGMVNGMPLAVNATLWNAKSQKAKEILLPVAEKEECKEKCITLNLVGFSRGAVSTMHFTHKIFNPGNDLEYAAIKDKIKKINILVFDPVPGDAFMPVSNFTLPFGVEYLGFYSEDERTGLFSPVFPNHDIILDIPNLPFDFFMVPGSHETMVGNIRKNGHVPYVWPFNAYNGFDEKLDYVSRILKIVATEILGSSDWGHVRFRQPDTNKPVEKENLEDLNLDWYKDEKGIIEKDIAKLRLKFSDKIDTIYAKPLPYNYYRGMHDYSYGLILEAWRIGCWTAFDTFAAWWNPLVSSDYPRCAYYGPTIGTGLFGELSLSNGPINNVPNTPPLNTKSSGNYAIWDLTRTRGSLDVDEDFVDYEDDNCPTVYNPDQVDVCESCIDTDADGYSDQATDNCPLVDNCPTVYNSDQADLDTDGVGDVCDDCTDTDKDGYGNPGYDANTCPLDNCPTVDNPDQIDVNNDGYGDACVCLNVNISDSVVIGDNPVIGCGTVIKKEVSIGNNAQIGADVIINKNSMAGNNLVIGNGTLINKDVVFGDNVVLGDNVKIRKDVEIGNSVVIGDDVVIEENVVIGSGVIISNGETIKKDTVIPSGF